MTVSFMNYVPDYTITNREGFFVDGLLYDQNYVSVNRLTPTFKGFFDVQLFLLRKSIHDSNYIVLII